MVYLNEEQTASYMNASHFEGIDYLSVKLDPVAFEAAEAKETVEEIPEEPVDRILQVDEIHVFLDVGLVSDDFGKLIER